MGPALDFANADGDQNPITSRANTDISALKKEGRTVGPAFDATRGSTGLPLTRDFVRRTFLDSQQSSVMISS
jgi:hypothetical protein